MPKHKRRQQLEQAVLIPLDWVEERSGLVGYTKWFLFRKVPHDISWSQTLGSAALTAFIVQAGDGSGPGDVLQAGPGPGVRVDPAHHERRHARVARPRDAQVGRERLHHPDLLPHGPRVPVRRLQVSARAELDRRRPDHPARPARGLHRLPAAVGPDVLLGDRRRHQPERDGALPRPLPGAVPPGRRIDQPRHAFVVLLDAHAPDSRRADRVDRAAHLPRHPARRQLAAVVGHGCGPRARRARARRP